MSEIKLSGTVEEKAYAKLNISLDVTARRNDGYHDMLMVMQSVSLCDDIRISLDNSGKVRARSNLRFVPNDERNLAVKAALRFLAATGNEGQGMLIEMKKRVPVGAGIGGGSSDAAAVLRALNRIYDKPLSETGLEELGASIGSDVPFCVWGGTSLAAGRGEKLRTLPPMPDCEIVICKPGFSVSTPDMFKKLDQIDLRCHPDTEGLVAALHAGDLPQISRRMYNVFEDVHDRRMYTVADIKNAMLDCGALGAIMTGTGSAVFGVFEPGSKLEGLCEQLEKEYGFSEHVQCIKRIEY